MSLASYCGQTVEDREDELFELIVKGGGNDDGRAAFCQGSCKDLDDARKRQSIAELLASINDGTAPVGVRERGFSGSHGLLGCQAVAER